MRTLVPALLASAFAAVLGTAATALAQDAELELVAGQRATGEIRFDGDEHRIAVELVKGQKLTVTARGARKSPLIPEVDVEDAEGDPLTIATSQRVNRRNLAIVKLVEIPATGSYSIVVRGTDAGPTGNYTLATRAKPAPRPPRGSGEITGVDQMDTYMVDAPNGALLTVIARGLRRQAVVPRVTGVTYEDGDGETGVYPGTTPRRDVQRAHAHTLSALPLPQLNRYTITIESDGDALGKYTATFVVRYPRPPRVRPHFVSPDPEPDPEPALTDVSPDDVTQGDVGEVLTITGQNLDGANPAVTLSSSGVTITSGPTVLSAGSATITVSVGASAALGTRSLTFTTDAGSDTLPNAFSVLEDDDPPPPGDLAVTSLDPDSGSAFGGERITITGTGFERGCQVEFGAQMGLEAQFVSATTLVVTVPDPGDPSSAGGTTVSTTAGTSVDVKVTNDPGGTPESATLNNGYAYGAADGPFTALAIVPALDATDVPHNLKSAVVVLSRPANTHTAVSGTTTGTHVFWFEGSGFFVSNRSVGFGADRRYLVLSRSGGGNLPVNSAGEYILDVPITLKSASGRAFAPAQLIRSGTHDQWSFNLSGSVTTDTTAPSAPTFSPANSSSGVVTTTEVTLTFGEALDPLTVTTSTITLTLTSGGTSVPCALSLSSDLKTVTLTPHVQLAASTSHTITVKNTVADLFGNTMNQATAAFTTNDGTDSTDPTITVVIEDLPSDMDGSGTFVNGSGSSQAFDLYLPRSDWEIRVEFVDEGGSGIDASTFSAKASVAAGGMSANAELASLFDVTATGATWRVGGSEQFAAGTNVTVTFNVDDMSGNSATQKVVTLDIVDKDTTAQAGAGGDHDPFDSRDVWVLRNDVDVYSISITDNGSSMSVTTSAASNGTPDIQDALRINGLQTTSMTTASSNTTNGNETGTNDIVARMFMERLREATRRRYSIDADGTHGSDAVNIEFLLNGEQGSLSGVPSLSSSESFNTGNAYSELDIGGDTFPNNLGNSTFGTVGRAFQDPRNRRQEANVNEANANGVGTNTGIFCINMFKFLMNSSTTGSDWGAEVLKPFQSFRSNATPVGESALDSVVLAGTFNRSSGGNTQAQNDRYDAIMDAIEQCALSVSGVAAHEIGHSLGLVPDDGPPTGFFGDAHLNNTFTEATQASPNTGSHLDYLGNDIMAPASSANDRTATGTDFQKFSPYDINYLRQRQVYDEGK